LDKHQNALQNLIENSFLNLQSENAKYFEAFQN
jgi:hypothetical protein